MPTCQSYITRVKQITYKHNTQKDHYYMYVYIIAHLYGSKSYNHEKVNFRLFNAYNRCKAIKVKNGDSAINWNKTMKDWVAAINWTQIKIYFKYKSTYENTCILSLILVSALFQKRKKGPHSPVKRSTEINAYMCDNHMHSAWLEICEVRSNFLGKNARSQFLMLTCSQDWFDAPLCYMIQ